MTIDKLPLLAAAAALCACGGRLYWKAEGRSESQVRQDKMACEEEVANYSRYMGAPGDAKIVEPRMLSCMRLRGYSKVPAGELPKDAPRID